MGIFDKFSSSRDIELTPRAALTLATITMIAIDGAIEDEEMSMLDRIVRGDGELWDQVTRIYKDRSIEDCITLVNETLNQEQKIVAVINMLDIAMADGMLAGDEEKLMMVYLDQFSIPKKEIENIVEVIAMKNNFSIF